MPTRKRRRRSSPSALAPHGLPKPQEALEINLQRRRCVDDIPAWSSRVTLRHDNVGGFMTALASQREKRALGSRDPWRQGQVEVEDRVERQTRRPMATGRNFAAVLAERRADRDLRDRHAD